MFTRERLAALTKDELVGIVFSLLTSLEGIKQMIDEPNP